MAARLIWSQAALDDIDAVADYISRDSTYHAQRDVEGFFALGDSIAEHLQLGRAVPELGRDHVRERFSTAIASSTKFRATKCVFLL